MLLPLLKHLRAQVLILALIAALALLTDLQVIPSASEIELAIQSFVARGYLTLAGVSFVENLVGLNTYFPGSIAILTGMASTSGDPSLAAKAFFSILGGSLLAHVVNFNLGRRLQNRAAPKAPRMVIYWTSCWHPHFAAIVAIAAGQEGVSMRDFAGGFLPAFLFWNVFWGLLMYLVGFPGLNESTVWVVILAVVLWGAWDARRFFAGVGRESQNKHSL